ncbi:Leucine-rich repeat-containing N-terminal plant-type protein [Dioscorea alata]|uniref:Leucine-rich repeat-containing N-terminal plant-type protein n=1 Tax=Dioscorea alata TaxID=55571 RepID=A0ACB7U6A0_DIOAL|nr:Leucine-rich repeat-containing N-terminal plant-type protein [Dioscorea alata]
MSKLTLPNIIFTIILLCSFCFPPLVSSDNCHSAEKKALLKLKAGFGNPEILNWTSATSCCSWPGVTCLSGRVLSLGLANLSGSISPAIAGLSFLTRLNIEESPNLTGPIPNSITKLPLTYLAIKSTSLSGPIPSFLGDLNKLSLLDLSNNHLTGPIPDSITSLPDLSTLVLSNNKLTGTIPPSLFHGLTSRTSLDLSNNRLTGNVPRSIGDANFEYIYLSGNRFSGDISFLFGDQSKHLTEIDLSRNMFEMNMSSLTFPSPLVLMDLSQNIIYGSIPTSITGLEQLTLFNVSYNRLCGRIPTGGRMNLFDASCYVHNKCLCGTPLPSCHA